MAHQCASQTRTEEWLFLGQRKSLVYFVIGAGSLEAAVFMVEIDHSLKAFGKKKKSVALTRAEEQSLAVS